MAPKRKLWLWIAFWRSCHRYCLDVALGLGGVVTRSAQANAWRWRHRGTALLLPEPRWLERARQHRTPRDWLVAYIPSVPAADFFASGEKRSLTLSPKS